MSSIHQIKRLRQGSFFLPAALVLGGILLVVGISGATQVSASRRLLELADAKRQQLLVAGSAFEEASSRLEQSFSTIPYPGETDVARQRNLRVAILPLTGKDWPARLETYFTRASCAVDGIQVSPVSIRVSDWILRRAGNPRNLAGDRWAVPLQELGVVEMKVRVTVSRGGVQHAAEVTVRRYMDASAQPGEPNAHLHVLPRDMILQVAEA